MYANWREIRSLIDRLKRAATTSKRSVVFHVEHDSLFPVSGRVWSPRDIVTSPSDGEPGAIFHFDNPERAISYLENLANLRLWKLRIKN